MSSITAIKRFFLGAPLTKDAIAEEKLPKWKALAVLSSDALSSVAYATEEILIPLALFSMAALAWSVPVACAIAALLLIVSISYRQTIEAYPTGGGAYMVAKENLGVIPGLTAAAAVMLGYLLTVAVSIAAGVGALTSAFPAMAAHKIPLAGLLILAITVLNLRGTRESASVFAFPTYVFIFSFLALICAGAWKVVVGVVPAAEPVIHDAYPAVPVFLLMRAFASGCAALTGIEAISNGVPAFRHPAHRNAKITLTWMAAILAVLFFGFTAVAHSFGIAPAAGETAVSQLSRAVFGTGPLYYVVQVATAMILIVAANASYNGMPWLTAMLARDRYLPRQLAALGDRLVFSNGILALSVVSFLLIVIFDGDPHALIPLYAVGVFLGFTLSQLGMLRHHRAKRKPGWRRGFAINALGAATTFTVMLIVAVTKFAEGAWIVIVVIPVLVTWFVRIHQHYLVVGRELSLAGVEAPSRLTPMKHTAVIPISGIHRGVVEALRYALSISDDVRAVYVEIDAEAAARMQKEWARWAHEVPLVTLRSPYRSVIRPLLAYLDDLDSTTRGEMVTVIIPEFVTGVWWHKFLHNQTALLIRTALLFRKGRCVTSVRYHLKNT